MVGKVSKGGYVLLYIHVLMLMHKLLCRLTHRTVSETNPNKLSDFVRPSFEANENKMSGGCALPYNRLVIPPLSQDKQIDGTVTETTTAPENVLLMWIQLVMTGGVM